MSKYELTICLRVYPGIANKQKVFCDDKITIFQKSLSSLIQWCGDLKIFYYIILDNCPSVYHSITNQLLESQNYEIISYATTQWNAKTFAKQIDILAHQSYSDIVYFAEDDYLYQPKSIEKFYYDFKNDKADFGTIYYSPDYKTLLIQDHPITTKRYANHVYEYRASTTMTFFVKKYSLLVYKDWLLSYTRGNHDFSMRFSITKFNIFSFYKFLIYLFKDFQSLKLWWYIRYKCNLQNFTIRKWTLLVPQQSWATHIDKSGMAIWYDWKKLRDSIS